MKVSRVPAHHQRQGRRGWVSPAGWSVAPGSIRGVVIHDMEAPERLDTAENCARYFARSDIRPSSAHRCFDADSMVVCVDDHDEAFHAPPASRWTIGYEQAGYARQSAADWHDPFSWAMIRNVAKSLAADAAAHGFPLVLRTPADLRAGKIDGVYSHDSVSKAWGQSSHWDPGLNYPMGEMLQMASEGLHTVAPPPAASVMKLNDRGANVAFLIDMTNIMAKAGMAINSKGKPSYVQLPVPKDRKKAVYDRHVRERVAEVQRFGRAMARLAKQPLPDVDGVAGKQTAAIIAFWVPIALKKLR